jgi:hypothetical protein
MAQRKITAGEGVDPADLPELTPQQKQFVEGILAGKTASDAYRGAYNCDNSSNKTIWVDASRLKNHPDIVLWIDAAKAAGFSAASCTYEEHLRELERLRNVSERSGNLGAAVQAEQLRGKVAGHYVDRIQDMTPQTDAIETLKQIEKHSPELAASLAAQAGIEWRKPEDATLQ